MPNENECYSLTLKTTSAYGWRDYAGSQDMTITPGVEIYSGGNLIFSKLNVGNFGSSITFENFLTTNGALGSDENEISQSTLSIFPNPSDGQINVNTNDAVSIGVYDVIGKTVYFYKKEAGSIVIDLSHLENGIYIAKITGTKNEITTQKIIIDK